MSSPFVAEIRMFGFNFAPTGWAFCDGQLMPISQNTALFSLLGTFYGGDGKSTFALPNLQGSAAMCQGQSSVGTDYFLGQQSGSEFVTLIQTEIPIHTHNIQAYTDDPADTQTPGPQFTLGNASGITPYLATAPSPVTMNFNQLSIAGGSLPHNNMSPYLTVNFCIALQGVFPARN